MYIILKRFFSYSAFQNIPYIFLEYSVNSVFQYIPYIQYFRIFHLFRHSVSPSVHHSFPYSHPRVGKRSTYCLQTNFRLPRLSQPPRRRPLGFVCHSPWGRNECVTNEPQRTSAGRLRLSYIRNHQTLSCQECHNPKWRMIRERPRHELVLVAVAVIFSGS